MSSALAELIFSVGSRARHAALPPCRAPDVPPRGSARTDEGYSRERASFP